MRVSSVLLALGGTTAVAEKAVPQPARDLLNSDVTVKHCNECEYGACAVSTTRGTAANFCYEKVRVAGPYGTVCPQTQPCFEDMSAAGWEKGPGLGVPLPQV